MKLVQPVAIDISILNLIANSLNNNYQYGLRILFKISELLIKYHTIFIEAQSWESEYEKAKNSIVNQEFKKMFADLFDFNRSMKYLPKEMNVDTKSSIINELALETPDKILINEKILEDSIIKYYDIATFTKENPYPPDCRLLRFQKIVPVPTNYEFNDLSFLKPFLINANKLELMDRYLFKDNRENDIRLILDIVSLSNQLKNVEIHFDQSVNLYKDKFCKEFKELFPFVQLDFKKYNEKGNKERFLIINNKYSVRMAVSFNNFEYLNKYNYKSKQSFQFTFTDRREYRDYSS